jgi:hypothetical protein
VIRRIRVPCGSAWIQGALYAPAGRSRRARLIARYASYPKRRDLVGAGPPTDFFIAEHINIRKFSWPIGYTPYVERAGFPCTLICGRGEQRSPRHHLALAQIVLEDAWLGRARLRLTAGA